MPHPPPANRLFYGDCLQVMQTLPEESVDLIYLDPPFNSKRAYNTFYRDASGKPLPDQIQAFCDTWELNAERENALDELPQFMLAHNIPHPFITLWQGMADGLRYMQPDMLAYLSYMLERLILMHRMLKPTGSIYLHCDPTASHYLKLLLDGIFGRNRFRNEIIWNYGKWTNAARFFQRNHDTILFYTKTHTRDYTFNPLYVPRRQDSAYHTNIVDGKGQLLVYQKENVPDAVIARYQKKNYEVVYVDKKGVVESDTWTYLRDKKLNILNSQAAERMNYPTQKPLALMAKIIAASSNAGDVVMDPFCGCASTIVAAHKLGRNWIGIDIAYHAIRRVAQNRLSEHAHELMLEEGKDYLIDGIPRTADGARDLWRRDKHQFQRWAVETVNGFVTSKRGHDGGIDGRIYYSPPGQKKLFSMIIEVKGGDHVGIDVVRGLRGAMEREPNVEMAGLIVDRIGDAKRRNFQREMASAGFTQFTYATASVKKYPRMQLLTLQEILDGKTFATPHPYTASDAAETKKLSKLGVTTKLL